MIRQLIAELSARRGAPPPSPRPAEPPGAVEGIVGGVVQDRPPARAEVARALVTPGRQRPGKRYSGEVYDARGRLEPLSLRPSARADYRHEPEAPKRATARLAGRHLYAGPLFGIFGHDIVELPGRLWPLLEAGARFDGIVAQKFLPGLDGVQLRLDQTIATVLAAFGIGFERIHLVEAPTEVEALLVPEPALHINHFGLPVLGDCFRRIAAQHAGLAPKLDGRGLYLSRSGLGGGSRIANEPEVEAAARRAGLAVLHPERLGLPLQIALMAEAPGIAGTDGSALHLAAFARPGTRLLSLDTRDLVNQRIVNAVAGLDARSIAVPPGGAVPDVAAELAWVAGHWPRRVTPPPGPPAAR